MRGIASVLALGLLMASPALAQEAMVHQASTSGAVSRVSDQVQTTRNIQESLEERGLYEGGIDGLYGPETESAVRRFQQEHHLKATGRVDASTLVGLGLIAGKGQMPRLAQKAGGPRELSQLGPTAAPAP